VAKGIFVLGMLLLIFGIVILVLFPIIGFLGILIGVVFVIVGITTEEAEPAPVPPPPAPVKPETYGSKHGAHKAGSAEVERKLPAPGYVYCPYCGEQIPKTSKFCPNCGAAQD